MMLSASPFQYPYQSQNQTFYQPSRPSPLSERSANVLSRAPIFNSTMASQPQPQHEKKSVPVSVPVPQRQHKPNPVMQTRDQATQRRRDMFFRRVQKDREDRKWNARGEQLERLDVLSDQKRWEAEKARQAPELSEDFIDEDTENDQLPQIHSNRNEQDMDEADYVLSQEEQELQALIALMEEQEQNDAASQHYGSDDDDYDQIFMECTDSTDWQQQTPAINSNTNYEADAMDMTDG